MASPSFPPADYSQAFRLRDRRFGDIPRFETLSAIVADNRARLGRYDALWFDGVRHSNVELIERAQGLAAGLHDQGVGRRDRVVVNLANSPDIWTCYLACAALGAVIVPTIPALTIDELGFVVRDAEAVALISTGEKVAHFRSERHLYPSLRVIIAGGKGERGVGELIAAGGTREIADRVGPDDLAAIIYTSGTTGKPKGVMLKHRSICRQACLNYGFYVGPGEDSAVATLLMPLPMCHIFGLAVGLTTLLMGNLTVMMERFDPALAVALIQEHGVRIVPAVPTMLSRLLSQPEAVSSCKSVTQWDCGGSALPVELLERVERELGGLVTEGWGLSEASSAVVQNVPGVPRKPGSVGIVLPGLELACRRVDGAPCDPDEPGELLVRGETIMAGYWNRPEASAKALDAEGFLHTGDIGTVDADGYCTIIGRKDDLIIRGGQNISPREIEEVLQRHPAVKEAAVLGVPNADLGQIVVAFVVPSSGARLDVAALTEHCRGSLARHKIPARLIAIAGLPYNNTGKVVKEELRRLYAGSQP